MFSILFRGQFSLTAKLAQNDKSKSGWQRGYLLMCVGQKDMTERMMKTEGRESRDQTFTCQVNCTGLGKAGDATSLPTPQWSNERNPSWASWGKEKKC